MRELGFFAFIENAVFQLTPEKRRYFTRGQITSETDIKSTFLKDIYINIGEQIEDNSGHLDLN